MYSLKILDPQVGIIPGHKQVFDEENLACSVLNKVRELASHKHTFDAGMKTFFGFI